MNKETFKDRKGTFHYEPVVWGDWKEGDVVVFEGYLAKTYYDYTVGETYTIGWEGEDLGPLDTDGYTPPTHWDNKNVFKFCRKVYDVVETENKEQKDSPKQEKSLDNLLKELHNLKQEEKELSAKVDNILKEINSVVGLYGLGVLFTNEYDMLQEND